LKNSERKRSGLNRSFSALNPADILMLSDKARAIKKPFEISKGFRYFMIKY